MTAEPQYRQVPGHSGLFVRDSLWMSADHLLSVRRNPFQESYRRYYFADIQAIVVTEFPDLLAAYGYIAAVLLAVMAAALMYTGHPVWASLCTLVSLVSFFLSWRSRDCACYLQTSVSTERLPSLRKRVDAGKSLALLKTEIERVQGSVSAAVLETLPSDARAGPLATPNPTLRHCTGFAHWTAFALMLVRAALAAISLYGVISTPLNIVTAAISTVILLLLILASIQQRRSDLAAGARRLVYAALAFYVASGLASVVLGIYVVLQLGPRATNRAMIAQNPVIKAYELVDVIGFLLLGCTGLILMWSHQRAVRTPPPLSLGNGG